MDGRSCQEVKEEKSIKHLLCECKALYRKRIATIARGFLDDVSLAAQIKLFVRRNFIRSTAATLPTFRVHLTEKYINSWCHELTYWTYRNWWARSGAATFVANKRWLLEQECDAEKASFRKWHISMKIEDEQRESLSAMSNKNNHVWT